jgi:uncharacterized protein YcnI
MTRPGGTLLPARRLLTVAAVSAATLLAPLAAPAAAHVTVLGPGATQGGYTKLTFRMPSERDVATTGLEVAMPTEQPITSVRVKPQDGWSYELVRTQLPEPIEQHGRQITEVVERIVWTATGPGVGPTEFAEFEVSAGPLPETETLLFPALQTYADGEVVRWIEEPADGAAEPEHPAPVLEPAVAETTGDWVPTAALAVAVLALVTALGSLLVRGRRTG